MCWPWRVSATLETDFCVEALEEALGRARPEIFNTDQGSQFTSDAFSGVLLGHGIQISMDGRGRCMDNVFVERLWRSVKYEEVYLKAYESVPEARWGIGAYLGFYNDERPHQALGYQTPRQVFEGEFIEANLGQQERGCLSQEKLVSYSMPDCGTGVSRIATGVGLSLNLGPSLSK
jgi:transposase InsO family protein